jgi:hypothetical protein
METKNLVPTVVGLAVGLAVLYVTVRVVSSAWKSGQ